MRPVEHPRRTIETVGQGPDDTREARDSIRTAKAGETHAARLADLREAVACAIRAIVPMPPIRLAFSPDSDDLFMFWPLLHGKVTAEGLAFTHERADTETLNARAERGDVDVIAVSVARYATIARDWLLLPHGMSVGRGYGPVVVAEHAQPLAALR